MYRHLTVLLSLSASTLALAQETDRGTPDAASAASQPATLEPDGETVEVIYTRGS